MAGLGRRTHYRKHLTDSVLNDLPEPSENERIAKVLGTRGSNQFELVIDPQGGELDTNPQLAILPTKFRKLVWLKRNDFVICAVAGDDNGDSAPSADGGIRYMVMHILYKDQIKHLKGKGLWPKDDFFLDNEEENDDINSSCDDDKDQLDQGGDGIVYNDIDDGYFCNMNRIAKLKVEDSSDESDEESD